MGWDEEGLKAGKNNGEYGCVEELVHAHDLRGAGEREGSVRIMTRAALGVRRLE